jgi:hypothetical protein
MVTDCRLVGGPCRLNRQWHVDEHVWLDELVDGLGDDLRIAGVHGVLEAAQVALLLVSWAVAIWLLLGAMRMNVGVATKDRTCWSLAGALTLVGAHLAPQRAGPAACEPCGCEDACGRGGAAPNSHARRRGKSAGVHLADPHSDPKSATGPRRVSLSGLTIAWMLVT